jgi:hypothetical protein
VGSAATEIYAYEAAVSAAHPLAPLAGAPVAMPWDRELACAMRRRNVHIEEHALDALLQDLNWEALVR